MAEKACVYATGSFGRGEARDNSDLDLFIVGCSEKDSDGVSAPKLKRLDEVCVKAALILKTRELGIPDFDGDGKYLQHYSVDQLISALGSPEDDATNTFTARLLLLLESSPLIGCKIYNDVIGAVIDAYWGDFPDHQQDFVPAFLSNDILRLWRTFCVNYEARTERSPQDKKIKRKIKNYKLKFSRLMTCYSAILYLLDIYNREGGVSPAAAKSMCLLTPTERIYSIQENYRGTVDAHAVSILIERYDKFLVDTSIEDGELQKIFSDKQSASKYMDSANEFAESMFRAVQFIGGESRFHRILVV